MTSKSITKNLYYTFMKWRGFIIMLTSVSRQYSKLLKRPYAIGAYSIAFVIKTMLCHVKGLEIAK